MRRSLCCTLLALLPACNSIATDIASVRSPDFAGRTYARFCVSAPDADLRLCSGSEEALAAGLHSKGVEAVRLGDLLFAGKSHDESEVAAKVRETGAGAFLVLKPVSSTTDERWIPPSIMTTTDFGYHGRPWGWGYSSTWISGGYSISLPRATIEVRLFDVASEEVVWVASVEATGDGYATWLELRTAAATTAIDQLAKDGLLRTPPR